jgi:hypothetical protein
MPHLVHDLSNMGRKDASTSCITFVLVIC